MKEVVNVEELKPLLGKLFKDTLITDPAFGPYFILKYVDGGWGVMKTRRDSKENLKYRAQGYPSSFQGCLEMIARELQNEEGAVFTDVQTYIERWKEICTIFRDLYKKWDVNQI